jgi:hypothetical protein
VPLLSLVTTQTASDSSDEYLRYTVHISSFCSHVNLAASSFGLG